uniref:Uncharacterized protein n=1 Tax=uncultured marine virus TaxID=186617 RepID=A0A0F7LBL4_9VIRU|nr:hypothetical protein [uncultured marine virus]
MINIYIKFLVFLINTLNGLMIYLLQNVNVKERKNESIRSNISKYANQKYVGNYIWGGCWCVCLHRSYC